MSDGRRTQITPAQWRRLSLPARVRLRWLLQARPKQITPKRHALCSLKQVECEELIAKAVERFGSDHEAAAVWLAEQGHIEWLIWLILAGRGWGKTRTGAEDTVKYALEHPGCRIALVAPTFADGRDTMIEGESGVRSVLPSSLEQDWNRSLGELVLTNGSRMKIFSAESPERLRGPQHHRAWCDELAAWQYLQDTWDQLMFGLRLGENPQVVITTTPKPLKFVREMLKRAKTPAGQVIVARGSTFENARNLARVALQELKRAYEGTRTGRQELHAEVLDDVEGALWLQSTIDDDRLPEYMIPDIFNVASLIVVGVDPAVTHKATSNSTGIVVVGKTRGNCPFCHNAKEPHGLVLEDRTLVGTPLEWGTAVIGAFDRWRANWIVPETNNGGDLVITNLGTIRKGLPIDPVTASRGKHLRAEPVAALYEQHKVHHVGTQLGELEDEMTTWDPEATDANGKARHQDSPDRVDALVHALTKLMVSDVVSGTVTQMQDGRGKGRR